MISRREVFEIHRLHNEGFSTRSIARQLRVSRESVAKYLVNPEPLTRRIHRPSKLDPFQDMIKQMLQECPDIKAPVVMRKLRKKGYDGGMTILRGNLRRLRGRSKNRQPFIRFESQPGEQVQIDWGYFGCLSYNKTDGSMVLLLWNATAVCSMCTCLTARSSNICTRD